MGRPAPPTRATDPRGPAAVTRRQRRLPAPRAGGRGHASGRFEERPAARPRARRVAHGRTERPWARRERAGRRHVPPTAVTACPSCTLRHTPARSGPSPVGEATRSGARGRARASSGAGRRGSAADDVIGGAGPRAEFVRGRCVGRGRDPRGSAGAGRWRLPDPRAGEAACVRRMRAGPGRRAAQGGRGAGRCGGRGGCGVSVHGRCLGVVVAGGVRSGGRRPRSSASPRRVAASTTRSVPCRT